MDETVWSGFPFSGVAVAEDIRPFQIIHALAKGTSETERQTVSCLCFHPTHGAEPFPESFTLSSVLGWQEELSDLAVSLILAAVAL